MKRKFLWTAFLFVLIALLATGCSTPAPAPAPTTETPATNETPADAQPEQPAVAESGLADGTYFAAQDNFDPASGWKTYVLLEVKDGKIVSADWNGVSINAGVNKKEASKTGKYPMVEAGGAKAPWHEQAALVEAYLIEKQDPTMIEYSNPDGNTDAISGVSIHVKDFFTVAQQALAAGPAKRGPYVDGAHHAEQAEFDANTGWKDTVDISVVNGNIMAVNWNGVNKNGGDDKKTTAKNGGYGMVANGGAKTEWDQQAMAAEQYLIETQDPTAIAYSDAEGHTDAISGVSIHVKGFFELAQNALK